jgi:hypothetical protein
MTLEGVRCFYCDGPVQLAGVNWGEVTLECVDGCESCIRCGGLKVGSVAAAARSRICACERVKE